MTEEDPLYDVREVTDDPEHASVEDVYAFVLTRARKQAHDEYYDDRMANVLERHDEETVCTVIHRILVDGYPFRTATVDLDMRNVDGIEIGTAATGALERLNEAGREAVLEWTDQQQQLDPNDPAFTVLDELEESSLPTSADTDARDEDDLVDE